MLWVAPRPLAPLKRYSSMLLGKRTGHCMPTLAQNPGQIAEHCPLPCCSWEAVLVVMDSEPFRDLHHILQDLNDDRAWVFAEWVCLS